MEDKNKTKEQLIEELHKLRQCVAELRGFEEEIKQTRRDQEKFAKAFLQNSIPVGITTLKEGRFVDVSNAFLKLMGRKREEVVGHTSIDIGFITEEQRVIFFNELNKNGRVENLELKVGTEGGVLRDGLFNAVIVNFNNEEYLLTVMTDISERKHVEDTLIESEGRLMQAQAIARLGSWEIDLTNQMMWASEEAFRIYGIEYPGPASAYMPLAEAQKVVHSEDRPRMDSALKALLQENKIYDQEFRIFRANDGELRVIHSRADLLFSEERLPVKIFGTIQDITDRKQVEEKLRESEERFKTLFEKSMDAQILLDHEGKVVDCNDAHLKLFGLQGKSEIIGHTPADFAPEVQLNGTPSSEIGKKIRTTILEKGSARFEWAHQKHDPARTPVITELSCTVIQIANRPMIHAVIRDITDRKQAEEKLRESEERYRHLVKHAPAGIYEVDFTTLKLLSVNDAMCQYTGYTREEFLSMNPMQLHTEESLKSLIQRHAKISAGEPVPDSVEYHLKRKDGSEFWALLNNRFSYGPNNRITSTVIVHDITESKRAQDAQIEQLNFLQVLMDTIPISVFFKDTKGIYLGCNRACETFFGPRDQLIGKTVYDVSPRDIADVYYRADLELFNNPGIQIYETAAADKMGARHNVIFNKATYQDKNGNVAGLIGAIFDITESKQAEEALRQSESTLRSVFVAAPIGICIMKDRLYQSANSFWCDTFGYPEESIIGKNTRMLYENNEEYDRVGRELYTRLSERSLASAETRLRRSDGVFRDVVLTAAPMQADDLTVGTVVIIHDVTDSKQAEEALRESEEKYRYLTERMSDVIWTLDSNFVVQYVSPSVSKALGFTPDERLKQTIFERITPESFKRVEEVLKFELQRDRDGDADPDRAVTLELEYYHKNGSTVWHETVVSSIRDIKGHIIGFHGASRDITKRKKLEKERTILEERLRRAEKMEAIGTLAGGIAHDFNNILGAVLGYTEMALGEPEIDNRIRHYLDQVFKAAERARDLVKQILAFSRQSDERPRPVRVGPIIKELLKLLRASLPTTIKIRQDIQTEPDAVLADPTRIHQILMNLCTNAAHAMQGEKGELKISLVPVNIEPSDDLIVHHDLFPGKYLRLTVGDTGAGIENEIIDRIFDPFFTTKKPGEGTGLGLSVVYGIVKSYGGAITVRSEVGKGTEFSVYLPLLTDMEVEHKAKHETPVPGGKERILFVDDEAALVQLATSILGGLGYEVTGRTSSLDALELFQTHPDSFDLVITDMTMPNMTGSELAQQLMRIRPGIPVILCTGFSEAVTQEKARAIGVKEFIMKPIVRRQIAEAIRRALDKKE